MIRTSIKSKDTYVAWWGRMSNVLEKYGKKRKRLRKQETYKNLKDKLKVSWKVGKQE